MLMSRCHSALVVLVLLASSSPALAVVPSTTSRIDHIADGETPAFTFPFVTYLKTDVEVLVAGAKQTEGFTVTLNANQASSPGGTVTFTAAPGAGATVRIQRTVPFTQNTVYTPYSAFPAKTTEKALDRGVMIAQQLDRRMTDVESTDFTGPQGPQGPLGPQGDTGSPGPAVYDIMLSFAGVPLNGQRLAEVLIPRAVTIPAGCTQSLARARVAPTAQATLTLKKNDIAVGTVTFNTNGTTAFTCSSPIELVAGDRLAWDAQATADATLAGLEVTLVGDLQPGAAAPTWTQGPAGPPGVGAVAWAYVEGDTTANYVFDGFSSVTPSQTNVGFVSFVFQTPRANTNYALLISMQDSPWQWAAPITKTANGFTLVGRAWDPAAPNDPPIDLFATYYVAVLGF
jgi:hypothetical protein